MPDDGASLERFPLPLRRHLLIGVSGDPGWRRHYSTILRFVALVLRRRGAAIELEWGAAVRDANEDPNAADGPVRARRRRPAGPDVMDTVVGTEEQSKGADALG